MKYFFFFIACLSAQSVFAQSTLPVIKATSKKVAINDGGFLDKDAWSLSPDVKPDVYTADRTRETKWVTFYTDIDSIRVKVKPGGRYDFIILLNGKDSCYTQIASAIPPYTRQASNIITHDTIPFTLTAYNAICIPAVINNTDTLNLHFDVGSFDFHLTQGAILKKTKLLSNQPDAVAGKATPNYRKLNKVYTLQLAGMTWKEPAIAATGLTAHDMDGRIGWNVFEGKMVEVDYDHNVLIIHSQLPSHLKGYVKSKLDFIHSYVCIKGGFTIGNKKYPGEFLFDTGSEQAVIVDSAWAASQQFSTDLKVIKSSVLRDPRNKQYEIKTVLAPAFTLSNITLTNIPTVVLPATNPAGFSLNFLGNDILKRFNMILDFKNDCVYMKPNKLINVPFRENS